MFTGRYSLYQWAEQAHARGEITQEELDSIKEAAKNYIPEGSKGSADRYTQGTRAAQQSAAANSGTAMPGGSPAQQAAAAAAGNVSVPDTSAGVPGGTAEFSSADNVSNLDTAAPSAMSGTVFSPDKTVQQQEQEKRGINTQLRMHEAELNAMDPVADITVPAEFWNWSKEQKQQWIIEKLRPTGYAVDRNGFGTIQFPPKRLRKAFNYLGRGDYTEASFEALPAVFTDGIEIDGHKDHKGRAHPTVTIAAPITINGKRGNLAAVVMKTTGNFYKVHRLLAPDGTMILFENKKTEAESTSSGGVTENGSLATPINSASVNTVAQDGTSVKGKNVSDLDTPAAGTGDPSPTDDGTFVPAEKPGKVRLKDPFVNAPKALFEMAQRISEITGREIVLFREQPGEHGIHDGYEQDGILYINVLSENPQATIWGHEYCHSFENTKEHESLKKGLRKLFLRKGIDMQARMEAKQKFYKRNGVDIPMDEAGRVKLENEVVAGYTSKLLFTSVEDIQAMVDYDPSIGQRILRWIDSVLGALGNQNAAERSFLHKAKLLYQKALSGGTALKKTTEYRDTSAEFNARRQELERQWAEGSITDEEYFGTIEALDEEQLLQESRTDTRKHSYAGINALTANVGKLDDAKQMLAAGTDNETIRQQTGWFQGDDGKWRFEIDDSSLEIADKVINYMSLGELVQHDALFAAYPNLADITVSFQSLPEGTNGQYDRSDDHIYIDSRIKNDAQQLKNVLVHEIQHVVQRWEGFANGASTAYWERKIGEGFDSRESRYQQQEQEADAKLQEIQQEQPDFYHDMMELEQMRPNVPRGEINWDTLERISDDPAEWKQFDAFRDQLVEKHGQSNVFGFMDLINKKNAALAARPRTAEELYYSTAGEIEARDAAARRTKDAEWRKNNPPKLGGEDVVFAERSALQLDKRIEQYPYNVQTVIREFMESIDADVVSFVESVHNGERMRSNKVVVATASSRMVNDIKRLTGIDISEGQEIVLNKSAVEHIDKRHGTNGQRDDSMRNVNDVARIGYVIKNYDSMILSNRHTKAYKNSDNSPAQMVVLTKKINGTYYVVAATPYNGTLGVITAYIDKNGAAQVIDDLTPIPNVQDELATTPKDSIPNPNKIVNNSFSPVEGATDGSVTDTNGVAETVAADDAAGPMVSRETLNTKARNYLRAAENNLQREIAKALSVPRGRSMEFLRPVIQQISDEYFRTGTVSQEMVDSLFEKAYELGIVQDREFYDQYKHIKDHLRTTAVTLSQQDQADIADFKDFRSRARYLLKIKDEGGTPVDVAYMELNDMAPELFPESITHPADQLQKMYDVADSIRISEQSLDAAFGHDPDFKKWAKNDFEAAIAESMGKLRDVTRYAADGMRKPAEKITTAEQAVEAWKKLKKARKTADTAMRKNLLTESDQQKVGRLLRGEITLEHLDPETDNVKGITAVYEAKQEYEELSRLLNDYKRSIKAEYRSLAEGFLGTVLDWKDKKSGFAYSRETMWRNIQDIVPDPELARKINEEYFFAVNRAEAKSTKFKNDFRNRVRKLQLSRKVEKGNLVSEAHAVQLYGEALDNIRILNEKYTGTYVYNKRSSYDSMGKRNNSKLKDDSEIIRIEGTFDAIISMETFNKVRGAKCLQQGARGILAFWTRKVRSVRSQSARQPQTKQPQRFQPYHIQVQ